MKSYIAMSILFVFLFACTSVKVVDTNSESDFSISQYKTFDFYEVSTDIKNPQYNQRIDWIKTTIHKNMRLLGLVQNSSNPDLLINIGITIEEKVQTRQTAFRTDAPIYMGQRRYSWQSEQVVVDRYEQGTVTVDLVDHEKDEMVWQGVVSGVVKNKDTKSQKNIRTGADKLFARIKQ